LILTKGFIPDDNSSVGLSGLNTEAQKLLHNLTGLEGGSGALHMPSVYHFLPHLLHNPASLKPAYQMSKGRSGGKIDKPFLDKLNILIKNYIFI